MLLSEGVKKIMLAGIGAVAVTAERSRELIDELVAKGELTVEQGRILNEELTHKKRRISSFPVWNTVHRKNWMPSKRSWMSFSKRNGVPPPFPLINTK